jgi:peptide subunit release factor 1 (eRF1)
VSKTRERPSPSIPELEMRDVKSLADFQASPYLVLSLYVNADTRTQELNVLRSRAHALLHEARAELERRWSELTHAVREAARDDLERSRAFVDEFRPRGACRGLALFACGGREWWQHFPLPRPVPDRFAWDADPLILPVLRIVEDYPRTGVILLDRETARFFGSRLGEVEELRRVRDDVPGRVREGGLQGLMERRIERHIEYHVHEHLKHAAAEARAIFERWPVARILVGGNRELFEDFRHCLVWQIRNLWAREMEIEADAPIEQVREVVLAAEEAAEREQDAALLRRLYDEWRSNGYGVVGIPETLRALYVGDVETLAVVADLQRPGFRCERCGALSEGGDECPICRSRDRRPCSDLVDEAIEDALAQGGEVEVVGEHSEFRRDGGMGALLRFRPPGARRLDEEAVGAGSRSS